MTYLFQLLFGFVEFSFTGGFYESFISDCFENGRDIKNIALCDGGITASCNIKTYKSLHRIAHKHGGRVKVIRKRGLPFALKPLKGRIGFFIGAVLFIFIINFLSGFVWEVQIKGGESVSSSALSVFLENSGLKSGTPWSVIERADIAWELMGEFEDVARAHINRIGTTAVLELDCTTPKPAEKSEEDLNGARVFRKTLEAVAYRQQSKITVKKIKRYYTVMFFGIKLPLYFKQEKGDSEAVQNKMITVRGKTLPIGISTCEQKFYSAKKYDLTDDKLTELARKRLELAFERELDGYEIINSSEEVDLQSDKCVIKKAYILRKSE